MDAFLPPNEKCFTSPSLVQHSSAYSTSPAIVSFAWLTCWHRLQPKIYVGTSIARYGPRHTKFQLPSLKPYFALYTLSSISPFVCGHLHSKYGPQHKITSISYPSSSKTRTLFILCFVPDLRLPTSGPRQTKFDFRPLKLYLKSEQELPHSLLCLCTFLYNSPCMWAPP